MLQWESLQKYGLVHSRSMGLQTQLNDVYIFFRKGFIIFLFHCNEYHNFNPKEEIKTSTSLVWIKIPRLQLMFWNENTLRHIGNKLELFIERIEPKCNIYYCAKKCVKVDLDKGFYIQINMDDWHHLQDLYYL